VAGYSLLQLAKFRKLSFSYEIFFTILISFPYLAMISKPQKADACTQTDMEMEELIINNKYRKIEKGFMFKIAGIVFLIIIAGSIV
tara:strand:+ start:129 stop:386 length:258 start_codon:yes stop_codon:yes gene_type:complete